MSDDLGRAPTRRSLREQRRAGEAADRARDRDSSAPDQLAVDSDSNPPGDTNPLDRVSHANRSRRAADVPFDMVSERGERDSLQRARDREVLRAQREAEAQRASATQLPLGEPSTAGDDPAPVTRRQLRLQALAAARAVPQETPQTEPAETGAEKGEEQASNGHLSVEEALEARRQTVGAPYDDQEPAEDRDDLEVIARQRELAARAAVISRRVAERERLKQSTTERQQQTADPFTGAMNRLRHEQAERDLANTGINAPVTNGFQLEMPVTAVRPHTSPKTPAPDNDDAPAREGSPASLRAEPQDSVSEEGGLPISAGSAQGLDPLDYLTAGVRRVNTWTLAVIAALVVGVGALVTGIVLISTNN